MVPESQIVIRILVAAILGMLIGLERERRNRDAGLRTHMILVIGSALAMTLSINLATQYQSSAPNADPARLAAQVISGIGFLGAGVIFRSGANVRGLTTAVSLWTMAIVGLAVGAGFYWTSVAVTVLLLVVLAVLDYIENHYIASIDRMHLTVWADYNPGLVAGIKEVLNLKKEGLDTLTIERDIESNTIILNLSLYLWKARTSEAIIEDLAGIHGIQKVKIDS